MSPRDTRWRRASGGLGTYSIRVQGLAVKGSGASWGRTRFLEPGLGARGSVPGARARARARDSVPGARGVARELELRVRHLLIEPPDHLLVALELLAALVDL